MNIEIRPKHGQVTVIGEFTKEDMMFHLYCNDEQENSFDIVLTREQMKELKKDIVRRNDIDKKRES